MNPALEANLEAAAKPIEETLRLLNAHMAAGNLKEARHDAIRLNICIPALLWYGSVVEVKGEVANWIAKRFEINLDLPG